MTEFGKHSPALSWRAAGPEVDRLRASQSVNIRRYEAGTCFTMEEVQ